MTGRAYCDRAWLLLGQAPWRRNVRRRAAGQPAERLGGCEVLYSIASDLAPPVFAAQQKAVTRHSCGIVPALESCIKIISDLKGWTTGSEKSAANYVSNLVSQKNGRFIEVWEGDMLTKMFTDVHNPFAHGPGQSPMPTLSPEQANWTIETAMTWIKSLVRRF